jgi:flagellar biosynthetic protein FliQ
MSASLAVDLILRAVQVCLMVAAPMLVTALLMGVLVSVIQAVTQLHEQTLTFIPKLLLIAVVFVLTLPWMLSHLIQYLVGVLRSLPSLTT